MAIPVSTTEHKRVILHIDIDCFYAQVEILKNPSLATKPVGVKQKNYVITSNFIAREYGIKKCMLIPDALQMCPKLVLVCGEDLTEYRKFSAKFSEEIKKLVPTVEKLGLDENYVDITSVVEHRETEETVDVVGHVYGSIDEDCECGCYHRLCIGSQIAEELRKNIKSSLGLTTTCGISYNKLLAKLVGKKNKPDQQTTVFPCSAHLLMSSLPNIRSLPGIGWRTYEVLSNLGIETISDLQNVNTSLLSRSLNPSTVELVKKFSYGIDDQPVKESEKQKSLGLEDAIKITTKEHLSSKIRDLLKHLQTMLIEDGRVPSTVKVTIRRFNERRESVRESRQSFVNFNPRHDFYEENSNVFRLIMHLINKMVNLNKEFHFTLIGVSFSKFGADPLCSKTTIKDIFKTQIESQRSDEPKASQMSPQISQISKPYPPSPTSSSEDSQIPQICQALGYDEAVFKELPPNIQKELAAQFKQNNKTATKQKSILTYFKK